MESRVVATLTRLKSLAARPRPAAVAQERCELCGGLLPAQHDHLVEAATGRMVCACQACAILFSARAGQQFRRVHRVFGACMIFR